MATGRIIRPWQGIVKPPFGVSINRSHERLRDLEFWLPFQEGGGSKVISETPVPYPATFNNFSGSPWTMGPMGQTVIFDSSNFDYISVPDSPGLDITGALTLAAWIYITDLSDVDNRGIITKYNEGAASRGYSMVINCTDDVLGMINSFDGTSADDVIYGSQTLVVNRLYHVASVFVPSTSVTLYIDGVVDVNVTSSIHASNHNTDAPLWIGANWALDLTRRFFGGTISEVRVYSRALDSNEILDLYTNPWREFETRRYWSITEAEEALIAQIRMLLMGVGV